MTLCEMCGREANLFTANVEGVEMSICQGCSKYGQVKRDFSVAYKPKRTKNEKTQYKLVANYANLIRSARNSRNMGQEDFSKFLQEKVSIVSKWESGKLKPSVNVARRLSKLLNLKLVEAEIEETYERKSKKSDVFTLGDFIKKRK